MDFFVFKKPPEGRWLKYITERKMEMENKRKKSFTMPHNYVIVFGIILFAMLLTYIVPAGSYERVVDPNTGRTVVAEGSFAYGEQSPVGPFSVFEAVAQGFNEVADIIFFVIFAYGWVNVLIVNGTFNAMMGAIIRKFDTKVEFLIPVIMILFGALGSTIGLTEETYGLIPVFVSLAIALGYDAIVGGAMIYVGVATGFASATLNPFTVGVAQGIAGVEYPYGLALRVVILVVFEIVAIAYVWRYAKKVHADPTKSILYGTKLDLPPMASREELVNTKANGRHVACGLVFVAVIAVIVYGTTQLGWYLNELSALFIIAMIVSGIIGKMNANQIAQSFVQAAKDMMFGALIIGLSRGIVVVLTNGGIIDTIIYGLSQPLAAMGNALGSLSSYVSAVGMLVVQNIINCFIGSGSGQASATMPIMAPLADLIGITRQTAVLAFQFGDGYSNMFWPSGVFLISGLMNIPANKWWKFVAPLFGIMFVLQMVFMCVAVAIGF